MTDIPRPKLASGIALLGGLVLIAGPLFFGLYGLGAVAAYILGLAGIAAALKTLVRPQPMDSWVLIGAGALAVLAALIAGGAALWVHLLGGLAMIGGGAWRRMLTEAEGGTRDGLS